MSLPLRADAYGYGTAASPSNRRFGGMRRTDDPNLCTVDLSEESGKFPRPPGDISAESVYNRTPEQGGQSPSRSPTQRREELAAREKCAAPQFLWPTMDSVVTRPSDVVTNMPIPLAVICNPFADGAGESTTLSLCDVGMEEPLRCPRCRAYINPFFKWTHRPREPPRFECNMCSHIMEVPETFLEDMDRSGQVADEDNHPELVFGSVDFTAPGHYDIDRPSRPSAPALCAVLDTTNESITSGFACCALRALAKLLEGLEEDAPVNRRICLMTFNQAVHFHVLTKSGRLQVVSMADLDDPYLPVAPGALFAEPTATGRTGLLSLIWGLEEALASGEAPAGGFECTVGGAPAGGAALRAGVEALSRMGGGDLWMFHATTPSGGLGALRLPEVLAPERTDLGSGSCATPMSATSSSSSPGSGVRRGTSSSSIVGSGAVSTTGPALQQAVFYEETLALCLRASIAASCVTAPPTGMLPQSLDTPTLQWLSWRTGGDTLHLPGFQRQYLPLLCNNLRHWADRMQASAYGCMVKLRTSKGIQCKGLLAPWPATVTPNDGSAFEVSRLSPDTSFAFMLQTEPDPENEEDTYWKRELTRKHLYVQAAVLYTTSKGERLLRLHTCMINVVPSTRMVHHSLNVGPLVALAVKQAVLIALDKKSSFKLTAKDFLLDFCVQAVASFQKHCCNAEARKRELALGRRLQLLPLFILSVRKLLYLAQSGTQDTGHAEELLRRLLRMPVHSLLAAAYPRVYALPAQGLHAGGELPQALRPSKESIREANAPAYLIANAFGTWFYQPGRGSDPFHMDSRASGAEDSKAQTILALAQAQALANIAEEEAQANPENTPECRAALHRAGLWRNAEHLTQRLREALAPIPVWMSMGQLTRLPSTESLDADVAFGEHVFLDSLFVEDEGVAEMEYGEWLHFVRQQVGKVVDQ